MAGSHLYSPLQIVHDNYILYVFAPNRESRQRWVFTLKEGNRTPKPTSLLKLLIPGHFSQRLKCQENMQEELISYI